MFTRYNEITVPKNYSGTRFTENDIETKTHRGSIVGGSSSIPPSNPKSYEENFDTPPNISSVPEESSPVIDEGEIFDEENENYIEEASPKAGKAFEGTDILSEFKSGLNGLFSHLSKDDLLLVGLILLLSDKGGEDSFSLMLMLSLLLLSK